MGLSNELSCDTGRFFHQHNPHWFFQSEVLRLYFPMLEPWVARSVSLPSCSSKFIHTQMWDCWLHQLPPCPVHQSPCQEPSLPSCPSLPFLAVWMNVSSLTPWLSDFHTVQFSVTSGCFSFLNLLFVLLLIVRRGKVYLPTPPSWP